MKLTIYIYILHQHCSYNNNAHLTILTCINVGEFLTSFRMKRFSFHNVLHIKRPSTSKLERWMVCTCWTKPWQKRLVFLYSPLRNRWSLEDSSSRDHASAYLAHNNNHCRALFILSALICSLEKISTRWLFVTSITYVILWLLQLSKTNAIYRI